MTETPLPYHFDPEELPAVLRDNLLGTEKFKQGEEDEYEYGIINPKAFTPVRRFVGMPGGHNLFASQEVTNELLPVYLEHEILCNRKRAGELGRCAKIEQDLLQRFSEPMRSVVVRARWETFKDLVDFYKIRTEKPKEGLHAEIAGTFWFLRRELRELLVWNLRSMSDRIDYYSPSQEELQCLVDVAVQAEEDGVCVDGLQGSDAVCHLLTSFFDARNPGCSPEGKLRAMEKIYAGVTSEFARRLIPKRDTKQ